MDLFACNFIYLGKYVSVEVTTNIAVYGMVLKNPILYICINMVLKQQQHTTIYLYTPRETKLYLC